MAYPLWVKAIAVLCIGGALWLLWLAFHQTSHVCSEGHIHEPETASYVMACSIALILIYPSLWGLFHYVRWDNDHVEYRALWGGHVTAPIWHMQEFIEYEEDRWCIRQCYIRMDGYPWLCFSSLMKNWEMFQIYARHRARKHEITTPWKHIFKNYLPQRLNNTLWGETDPLVPRKVWHGVDSSLGIPKPLLAFGMLVISAILFFHIRGMAGA